MTVYSELDAYLHITPDQLKACCPACNDTKSWARAFDDAIDHFDVRDVAMLIAQASHESMDFTRLEENLNYSMLRLREVWPARFPDAASTKGYARNPQALANNVYGGRMGNIESGDGWRYRGRGCIQLTGRYNYTKFADAINSSEPITRPDCLLEPEMAALSAAWFYSQNVPNGSNVKQATRIINGGTHGIDDRRRRYEICREVLS